MYSKPKTVLDWHFAAYLPTVVESDVRRAASDIGFLYRIHRRRSPQLLANAQPLQGISKASWNAINHPRPAGEELLLRQANIL